MARLYDVWHRNENVIIYGIDGIDGIDRFIRKQTGHMINLIFK